jgi:hypothetical protein
MLSRSTIFLGLMLTGTLALASLTREDGADTSEVVLPTSRASSVRPGDGNTNVYPALQLEKLARTGLTELGHNPFAGKSWEVSPLLPPVIPTLKEDDQTRNEVNQPSSAPSVPFRYMGRIQEEGERPVVFFTQGSQAYAVSEGDAIDDSYRLESVTPTQLVLVYLPLKARQIVDVSSLEAAPEESSDEAWSDTHLTYHRELQMQGRLQEADSNGL